MKTMMSSVAGESVDIHVVERPEDLGAFFDWIEQKSVLGADTETTGLDIFSDDFRIRTVQFGNRRTGWVLPVEKGWEFTKAACEVLISDREFVFHNAMYDLQVINRCFSIPLEETFGKVVDTRILAHLIDPRGQEEGGIGHSLEALTRALIDPAVADEVKVLVKLLAKEMKTTQSQVWSVVDIDNPDYLLYAGMDPILAYRLREKLEPLVPASARGLVAYEHRLAEVCAVMERNGFLVDTTYSRKLSNRLRREEDAAGDRLFETFGVESPNSTEQVADALEELGVKVRGRTPTGRRKVDKKLLDDLSELDAPEGELASLVIEAKRTRKWRTTWVDGFLAGMDTNNRVHPSINPLRARTARMSITGIPAQTLPSSDWMIRRCFIPDPGESLVSVDYKAQELRVLAALSGDTVMRRAFQHDADLHQITADAAGVDRKVGKMANFLQVYGGGPAKLAEGAGISLPDAKRVIDAFRSTYPGVAQFARAAEEEARQLGYVTTPTGRVLPVDESRIYAATNYCLAPWTPILTADMRHIPAEEVRVGDELVGFDEFTPEPGVGKGNGHRKFRTAVVEAISEVWKPSVVVRTSDGGETVCSADHLWFVRRPNAQPRYVWVAADGLKEGDQFVSIGTWEYDESRTAGYLAGLYDGEGYMGGRAGGKGATALTFSQKAGPILDEFLAGMGELGLPCSHYKRSPNSTSPTDSVAIAGVPKIMRTLGVLRPSRFIPRVKEIFDGAAICGGSNIDNPTVVSVDSVGEQKLVSIQTNTRTLIANGYLSHNCIQSTSRDVTCAGLLRLYDDGFGPYLRLPIHDEVLASVPADQAERGAKMIREALRMDFRGVDIDTDAEILGDSWGAGYVPDSEREAYETTFIPF